MDHTSLAPHGGRVLMVVARALAAFGVQVDRSLALGAADYMTKPFDLSTLVARVRALRTDRLFRSTFQSPTERSIR